MSTLFSPHSDLHLELQDWPDQFLNAVVPNVIALPGDIAIYTDVGGYLHQLAQRFPDTDILFVPGNHEGYGITDLEQAERTYRAMFAEHPRIHYLQKDAVVINGIRYLGCTLWSNFSANGAGKVKDAKALAQYRVNDFRRIGYRDSIFTPDDCAALGSEHLTWLEAELRQPFDGKTVVLTHFAPSMQVAHREYGGDALTPYFNWDLDAFIQELQPDLWVYAHTHDNFDIRIGETRVLCNQYGYYWEAHTGYQPNLVLEL